jgi:hypothetical protein
MKKSASVVLSLFLLTQTLIAATPQETLPRLTNQDVVEMFKAGLSNEVILSKIKTSRCNFDTDPSILAELKHKGLPNEILQAMVEAPYGPPRTTLEQRQRAADSIPTAGQEIVVPDGTEFSVETVDEISSKTASENDPVNLRVMDAVRIGNTVVIAAGTLVKGSVASVQQRGHLGKGGKLGLRVDSTTAVDGQKIRLRASKGKGDTDTVGSTIALSLLISPLFLLRRGNHAVIKPGTKIQVFTDEEKRLIPIKGNGERSVPNEQLF